MNAVEVLRALGPIDLKNVRRDAMLRWLAVYPIALALAVRWGTPALGDQLRARTGFDLVPYYGLVVTFVVLAVPVITGIVIGFLLLDQRDDHTLSALRVTPLTIESYLAYRIAVPILLSVAMTFVAVRLAGLIDVGTAALALVSVVAALLGPLYAVSLAAFARNKVQGFALMKGAGILIWAPVFAYFVRSPWQLVFGIVPHYWVAKLLWVLHDGGAQAWFYACAGVAYQSALLALLLHRFNRVLASGD
jgi:fluoroquinolone transport system permease protein